MNSCRMCGSACFSFFRECKARGLGSGRKSSSDRHATDRARRHACHFIRFLHLSWGEPNRTPTANRASSQLFWSSLLVAHVESFLTADVCCIIACWTVAVKFLVQASPHYIHFRVRTTPNYSETSATLVVTSALLVVTRSY